MRALLPIALAGLLLCACAPGGDDAEAQKPRRPHAVVIVLDELPGDVLLGPDGRIDAGRYPSFAALAGDSTWFRNAYTAYDSTTKAVPLIFDGIAPRKGTGPVAPPGQEDDPGFLRPLPPPPQRAAPPAPGRVRGPPAGPSRRPPEVTGDVRRHADRRHRGPRLRLAGGGGDAPQRDAVERRGARSSAADREAAEADAGEGERRLRADARRDAHPRRRA